MEMVIREALKACGVFDGLNDAEVQKVAAAASQQKIEAGATVFQEGDAADSFFVLVEGKVALQMTLPATQSSAVRRVTIDIVSPNQVFGWSAVVRPKVYTLSAVCLQRATVVAIDGAKLEQILRDDPHTGFRVMQGFTRVVASRLNDTRHVLVSERSFS